MREVAQRERHRFNAGDTYNTTALVHEAFLRMQRDGGVNVNDREHFMAYAATTMRSIIIDFVRRRSAERRGGDAEHVTLDTRAAGTLGGSDEEILAVHEALQIIGPMVDGQRPTFTGSYYRTEEALAQPRYRDHIPLMLGGSGEKKAIPMAARYFDHMNLMCDLSELPRKAEVVRRCCEDIGRDPATLATSTMVVVDVDGTMSPEQIAAASANFISGSPTAIAEQIKARVFDAGVGGVVLSVFDYRPGVVAELADALRPLLPA